MICEVRSLLNSHNQEEERNLMRPPLWHPPIELSEREALIIKRIKRAKLFGSSVLIVLIFQENAKEVMPVFQNLLNFSNQNHTFLIALI